MTYLFLKALALPPASLFVIVLSGLLIRRWRRRTGTVIATFGLIALYGLSMPIVGTSLLMTLEQEGVVTGADLPPAQAIVILSAGRGYSSPHKTSETVGSLTLERLRYGARLHRQTGLPILVAGGSFREDETPIGELMRDVMQRTFQTPVKWVEFTSKTTQENAGNSVAMLRRAGVSTVYLVTNSWHLPRATMAFERAGLRVRPYGAGFSVLGDLRPTMFLPSARALLNSYYWFHEKFGMFWYRLKLAVAG